MGLADPMTGRLPFSPMTRTNMHADTEIKPICAHEKKQRSMAMAGRPNLRTHDPSDERFDLAAIGAAYELPDSQPNART